MAGEFQLSSEVAAHTKAVVEEVATVSVHDAIGAERSLHPPLQPLPYLENYTFYRLQRGLHVASQQLNLLLPGRRTLQSSNTIVTTFKGETSPCPEESRVLQQHAEEVMGVYDKHPPHATAINTPRGQQSQSSATCTHHFIQKQQLFSVYVHTPHGMQLPAGSLFAGCELHDRTNTTNAYGQYPLVEAALLLLQAALHNKANAKFVLVGESSIPLYPPQVRGT